MPFVLNCSNIQYNWVTVTMKLLLTFFCGLYWIVSIFTISLPAYGPFKLSIQKLNLCRGPKQTNCTDIRAKLNGTLFLYDIDIKKNVIPNHGKITASMNGQQLLRLQMKKPCDHLFMKPLFQSILNVSQTCEFKKGKYFVIVDIEEVARKYYQGSFLFGNLTFKAVFYNDECNFSCVSLDVQFSPKDNSTAH